MIPLSKVRPVHREIAARMGVAGLQRVRGALRTVKEPGYKALFAGPPQADGRRPAIPVWISELDLLVAHDVGAVSELVVSRTSNAIESYRAMLNEREGDDGEGLDALARK